jgi:hypothetical protein
VAAATKALFWSLKTDSGKADTEVDHPHHLSGYSQTLPEGHQKEKSERETRLKRGARLFVLDINIPPARHDSIETRLRREGRKEIHFFTFR